MHDAVGLGVIGTQECRLRELAVSIVLAYVPTPEGWAALAATVEKARRRAADVVVVNVTRT